MPTEFRAYEHEHKAMAEIREGREPPDWSVLDDRDRYVPTAPPALAGVWAAPDFEEP